MSAQRARPKKTSKRRRVGPLALVLLAVLVYAVVFSALTMHRHEVFSSSRFDLGNMDQAVWNSSQGRILEATNEEGELTSRLANHTDFLLLAFVPFYWLLPSPHWLLVAQAAVVGLGALPLFWLAGRFLGRGWPAAFVAVAYLFNPGLQAANMFDFHAQTMAGTFLLFALHYLLEKRLWPFLVFGALAAMTKEGIVLIVGMMGLYVLLTRRDWRWGVPTFLVSAAYFFLTTLVIIPFFNAGGESRLVSERFEVLGGSMGGLVRTFFSDPLFVLGHMLTPDKVWYLVELVGYGGFLGLLAPGVLLLPASEVAINLLSQRPQMTDVDYHYTAPIMPFVYLAAAAGLARLSRLVGRLRNARAPALAGALPLMLSLWLLLFTAYVDYLDGPFYATHLSERQQRNLDEAVAMVPDGAKVSASNLIGPHLAHRRHLYLFPVVRDAEYVVVDKARPSYHTTFDEKKMERKLKKLRNGGDYRVAFERRNVVVLREKG